MASISFDKKTQTRRVQFVVNGKRQAIRLGKVSQRQAQSVCMRIEAILAAKCCGMPLDAETALWVTEQGDDLADKLAAAGLISPRCSAGIGEFMETYLAERKDLKKNTRLAYNGSRLRILRFFDPNTNLRDITPGEADRFAVHLRGNYAQATASVTIRHVRQFFKAAIRRRIIRENPFADLLAGKQSNSARQVFIPRETVAQVLDACPTNEWRLIFALSRYAGLRCPSEHLGLRWKDILWDKGRMMVHAPKTEHHEDCGVRAVPIFPELLPYLERAFESAEVGQQYVITRTRDASKNLRTLLFKILAKAGVKPWPRLFQNLRASCETELIDHYPAHVVTAWMGHTVRVAQEHYLSVTEEHFRRGAKSGAVVAQKAAQTAPHHDRQRQTELTQPLDDVRVREILSVVVCHCPSVQISSSGIEPDLRPSQGRVRTGTLRGC